MHKPYTSYAQAMQLMFRVVAAGAFCALVAGCVPETGEPELVNGGPVDPVQNTTKAACEAAGGQIVVGLAGPTCAKPTKDAGKACSDSSQCEGFCLAQTKTCTPTSPYFGCFAVLERGQTPTLCVD